MVYRIQMRGFSGQQYQLFYDSLLNCVIDNAGTKHTVKADLKPEGMDIRLILGKKCNLACSYCIQRLGKSKEPDLVPFEDKKKLVQAILRFMADRPLGNLQFWGGEPFMYFRDMQEYYILFSELTSSPFTTSIATNGTMLFDEQTDWLIDNNVYTWVSYDGRDFELRGVDLLADKAIVKSLVRLQQAGLALFNPVITKTPYDLLDYNDRIATALNSSHIRLGECRLVYAMDEGSYTNRLPEEMLPVHADMMFKGLISNDLSGWEFAHQYVRKILGTIGTTVDSRPRCQVVENQTLAVDTFGNIVTCQNQPQNEAHTHGSIFNTSLAHIKPVPQLPDRYEQLRRSKCDDCLVNAFCKGSCPFADERYVAYNCLSMYYQFLAFFKYMLFLLTQGDIVESVEPAPEGAPRINNIESHSMESVTASYPVLF